MTERKKRDVPKNQHVSKYLTQDKSVINATLSDRVENFFRWTIANESVHGIYFDHADIAHAVNSRVPVKSDIEGVKNAMATVKKRMYEKYKIAIHSGGPGRGWRACYDQADVARSSLPGAVRRQESADAGVARQLNCIPEPSKLPAELKAYVRSVTERQSAVKSFDYNKLLQLQAAAVKPKDP